MFSQADNIYECRYLHKTLADYNFTNALAFHYDEAC